MRIRNRQVAPIYKMILALLVVTILFFAVLQFLNRPKPPDSASDTLELPETSTASVLTQTQQELLATTGCLEATYEFIAIVIDYGLNTIDPSIRVDNSRDLRLLCPGEEQAFSTYQLIVSVPKIADMEVYIRVLSDAIELIADYPPDEAALPPRLVNINMPNRTYSFVYEDAITALETGLQGQALLDELGIVVEMP